MTTSPTLTAEMIREIGEVLFGAVWQAEMAKGLGVPRQSVGYYLKSGGVSGAQAAAIIGLIGRTIVRDAAANSEARKTAEDRRLALTALMVKMETP